MKRILESTIPTNLISKIQSDGKLVSFPIQSVSVLFVEIGKFTRWPSTIPPQLL
jgi:hypothetical protein